MRKPLIIHMWGFSIESTHHIHVDGEVELVLRSSPDLSFVITRASSVAGDWACRHIKLSKDKGTASSLDTTVY